MKISILQENLNKALNTVGRIISTRSTLPILSHLLLKTQEGRLKVSATNLEIGVNFYVGGKIEKEGEITIPARLFSDFVASLPNEKIEIELKDLTLNCQTANYKANIKGIEASEFPLIPEIKKEKLLTVDAQELKEAILLTSIAASLEDTRPILTGVLLKFKADKLTLAATDSYRLAEKTVPLKEKVKKEAEVIIPVRSLQELARIIADSNYPEVDIYLEENQILFRVDSVELISRLIEGQFPNYKQIIPESYDTKAVLKKEDFISVVKVANLFARENANSVKINFNPKKNILEVSAIASQVGDNNSQSGAKIEGQETEIVFNAKYLLDVLANLSGKEVALEIGTKVNPTGLIRSTSDPNYLYIVMPLRG